MNTTGIGQRPTPNSGFTLLVLLLGIAGTILTLTVGIPMIIDIIRDYRVSSRVDQLLDDIALAQSEAIKHASTATLCKNVFDICNVNDPEILDDGQGWHIFIDNDADGLLDDNEALLRTTASSTLTVAQTAGGRIMFDASGKPAGGVTITVNICDSRGADHAQRLSIDTAGMTSVCSGPQAMLGISCTDEKMPICPQPQS